MTAVDISGLEQSVIAFVGVVAVPFAGWLAYKFNKATNIASDSAQATRVATGINAMAELAQGELASLAAHNPTIDIKNKAVSNAVAQASTSFNAATKAIGTTPDQVTQRVLGALETKLTTALAVPVVINAVPSPILAPVPEAAKA